MSNINSNNNNGRVGLGGYGGPVNGGVSQVQLEKCTNQNIDKEMFQLFGQNNLKYDNTPANPRLTPIPTPIPMIEFFIDIIILNYIS